MCLCVRVCTLYTQQSHRLSTCRTSAVELHNDIYIRTRTYHRRHLSGFPRGQIFARRFPKGITTLDRIPPHPTSEPLLRTVAVVVAGRRFKTNNGQTTPLFKLYYIYIYLRDYNARRMTVSNKHTYIILYKIYRYINCGIVGYTVVRVLRSTKLFKNNAN